MPVEPWGEYDEIDQTLLDDAGRVVRDAKKAARIIRVYSLKGDVVRREWFDRTKKNEEASA